MTWECIFCGDELLARHPDHFKTLSCREAQRELGLDFDPAKSLNVKVFFKEVDE